MKSTRRLIKCFRLVSGVFLSVNRIIFLLLCWIDESSLPKDLQHALRLPFPPFVHFINSLFNRCVFVLVASFFIFFGGTRLNWLLESPGNTYLLIAVIVWIQTGFAMVILSAAMKNVPDEIVEAAMLDGATPIKRLFRVTIPMIRATLVVVLTTIIIGTLKVFDIVRTMTGGNFQTNVIANEMYSQAFRQMNYGTGSALAIILFLAMIPVIIYNIRQLRLERTER